MNHVTLIGRLARDPEVRYGNNGGKAVARYTLAVDRRSADGKNNADFISCVCFDKTAEFVEKYLKKGMKVGVHGSIKTGNYTDRDGKKVYTTDVIVNEHTFCESANNGGSTAPAQQPQATPAGYDGFMQIPDNVDDIGLPFN